MADYNSMKVPELKKLLQSRTLGVTGNKADLVARLVEDDKKNAPADAAPAAAAAAAAPAPAADNEGLIDWSDDDEPAAAKPATATKAAEPAPVPAVAPVVEAPQAAAPVEEAPAAASAEPAAAEAAAPAEEPAESAPKESFALNLGASDVSEEARKRAERAKRFGITEEAGADDETKKKAERAKRFGAETGDLSKSLDAALPERERRPKRGREGEQGGRDSNKRQTTAPGGRGGRNQNQNQNRGRGQGQGQAQGGRQPRGGNAPPKKQPAAVDPAEKAKMDARAKRFAAST